MSEKDGLTHELFAANLLRNSTLIPGCRTVGVHGSWGRGKTDVLSRVQSIVQANAEAASGYLQDVLWINPWMYGTADLLSPIVLSLIRRLPPRLEPSSRDAIRQAARTVIKAGISCGLKAVGTVVPGAGLMSTLAGEVTELVDGMFSAVDKDHEKDPDPDPVERMAERFSTLVRAIVEANGWEKGRRLLICLDDLDRCLPDRQVALLEAIHFLAAGDAPVTFFIAIDPILARQALVTHFKSTAFDPDRYLDKMFDLRVTLPALSETEMISLIGELLNAKTHKGPTLQEQMSRRFSVDSTRICESVAKALAVPDLRNPRIVKRIIWRASIFLEADENVGGAFSGVSVLVHLFAWLATAERWPQIRAAIQDAGPESVVRWKLLSQWYRTSDEGRANLLLNDPARSVRGILEELPSPNHHPQLRQFLLGTVLANDLMIPTLDQIEKALQKAGV